MRTTRAVSCLISSLLSLAVFVASAPAQTQGKPASPARQLLIVSANLREGFPFDKPNQNHDDVNEDCTSDLQNYPRFDATGQPIFPPEGPTCYLDVRNFAQRLHDWLPYAPDVLLLQEVVRDPAHMVAYQLEQAFAGYDFRVVVAPATNDFEPDTNAGRACTYTTKSGDTRTGAKARRQRETAIVINTTTMAVPDDAGAGYLTTKYPCGVATKESEKRGRAFRDHAFVDGISELDGGLLVPAMSVHLGGQKHVVRASRGRVWARWARELIDHLADPDVGGGKDVRLIGGDFNQIACSTRGTETFRCSKRAWWKTFTSGSPAYRDTVRTVNDSDTLIQRQWRNGDEVRHHPRIDFIFARMAKTCLASHDIAYPAQDPEAPDGVAYTHDNDYKPHPERIADHRPLFAFFGKVGDEEPACP